jgi:hypothetical protein
LRDALLSILRGTAGLAVAIRLGERGALGRVLLTLSDVETGAVGFAIVSVPCTLMTLVQRGIERVAVTEEIFAI